MQQNAKQLLKQVSKQKTQQQMKQELIDFTTLVKDMRRAQKAYFAARKKQDYQQSKRFLEESKKLEGQVDKWLSERRDKAIYGEESRLFK